MCSLEILLMVSASGIDLVGPVDLLQKHHPQQVVGKGHGGHGQEEAQELLTAQPVEDEE